MGAASRIRRLLVDSSLDGASSMNTGRHGPNSDVQRNARAGVRREPKATSRARSTIRWAYNRHDADKEMRRTMIRFNLMRMLSSVTMFLLTVLLPNSSSASSSQTISREKPAECRAYSVRRVEFIGNEDTGDRVLRRRIAFSEGKTLSERDIEQTIKKLNRLKQLEKLKRQDIEIKYAVEDPATPEWHCFADIRIHIREKTRR